MKITKYLRFSTILDVTIFAFLRETGGLISIELFSLFYNMSEKVDLSLFAFCTCNGCGLMREGGGWKVGWMTELVCRRNVYTHGGVVDLF